ncbi:hypothetical protein ACFY9N_09740 [Microbacterium sp. NPDC008134]|uniref:hypothetical protein n=1 Tax=Microbacterium sp. NPDC008134 TaxID=3364183 RepID=UPI0036E0C622
MSPTGVVPLTSAAPARSGMVRVSLVVRDERGFTHYYEEVETTADAVRDAYDLMARRSSAAAS